MRVLPLAEAKSRLSQLVAEVEATDTEVTITKNGRAAAVLVSFDEFERWMETLAITSDPESMKALRKGIADLEKGRGRRMRTADLDRLFATR